MKSVTTKDGFALWWPALTATALAMAALLISRAEAADVKRSTITVATYNVLNLFDAAHDEGKDDYTFLPLAYPGKTEACEAIKDPYYKKQCLETDWNDARVELKLEQVRRAVDTFGERPELLALQEVENDAIIGRLAGKLGYPRHLTTNGPDERGIDVALLFKEEALEYLEHAEIPLQGEGFPPSFTEKPTRPILRVHFRPRTEPTAVWGVYVNHWPSQAAGPDKRMAVVARLQKEIELQASRVGRDRYHVIVLGDFNVLDSETPNALHNGIMDPRWPLYLADAQQVFLATGSPEKKKMPMGSYFYPPNHSWDRLDRIFLSRHFLDGKEAEMVRDSYRIVAHPELLAPFEDTYAASFHFGSRVPRAPKRYDFTAETSEKAGHSDHLPLLLKIRL